MALLMTQCQGAPSAIIADDFSLWGYLDDLLLLYRRRFEVRGRIHAEPIAACAPARWCGWRKFVVCGEARGVQPGDEECGSYVWLCLFS